MLGAPVGGSEAGDRVVCDGLYVGVRVFLVGRRVGTDGATVTRREGEFVAIGLAVDVDGVVVAPSGGIEGLAVEVEGERVVTDGELVGAEG